MTHNGYTNYQTWATNLWLMNDEGSEAYVRQAVQDSGGSLYALADKLKDDLEESVADQFEESCLLWDLLLATVQDINFEELAEAFMESYGMSS